MSGRDLPKIRLETPALGHCTEFLAAVHASRELHRRWITLPTTPAAYRRYLKKLSGPRFVGHFVRTLDGGLAGGININEIVRGLFKSGYLGYYGFEPYTGQGLMSAGLSAVVRRAFGRHHLHRLEANIQPDNLGSINLVRRLGFRCEGLSRRYLKVCGRWRDHERWAILAEDFRNR